MVEPEHQFGPEVEGVEHTAITPESLWNDNHSWQARRNKEEFEQGRENHTLTAERKCCDARTISTDLNQTIEMGRIASGGEYGVYERLINHDSVKRIVVQTHIDADTQTPGEMPSGCGGQKAKAASKREEFSPTQKRGIQEYVCDSISSEDPVLQANTSAERTAYHTLKPVLASVQDHLSGRLIPVGLYVTRGKSIVSLKPKQVIGYLNSGAYDPKVIYREGIPEIERSELPDVFQEYMDLNDKIVEELERKFPNLRLLQKNQDPPALLISTVARAAGPRYPKTFGEKPGQFFKILVPRDNIDSQDDQVTQKSMKLVLAQAEYPLIHSVENHGKLKGDFIKLSRIIIENRDMRHAVATAKALVSERPAQEWLEFPDHKIFVAEVRQGLIRDIDEFDQKQA